MKKENLNIKFPSLSLIAKKYRGFTLAEILLSLSIIGIVAAIALPSLLGNVNERAFETQKKALYTRFSQALPLLPSLNGYGTLEGTLSDEENEQEVSVDTATESFIRDGLSKVMKVTNICDSEHLTDCGLPDKIIPLTGNSTISLSAIDTLGKFNNAFRDKQEDEYHIVYEQLDTKAASFETVNGESVLVYYNPNCVSDLKNNATAYYSQPRMCANFIYDLNGKKGPNTVGKDIGFITALYSMDPIIVAPIPYNRIVQAEQTELSSKCKEKNENLKVPNIDELISLFVNKNLLGSSVNNFSGGEGPYSSTVNPLNNTQAFFIRFITGKTFYFPVSYSVKNICIYR